MRVHPRAVFLSRRSFGFHLAHRRSSGALTFPAAQWNFLVGSFFKVQARTDRGQLSLEKLFTTTTGTDSQDQSKRKRLALEGTPTQAGNCPWGSTLILAVILDWGRVRSVHNRLVFLSRFARSCLSSIFRW